MNWVKKCRYFFSLITLTFLLSQISYAQAPDWLWANNYGSGNMDLLSSIAIDDSGNVYSTGYFQDTVDFDPGPGTYDLTAVGGEDIFISKVNNSGNLVWAKSIGGPGFDWSYSLKLDGSGNVIYASFFTGTVDMDPGVDTFEVTSAGLGDILISKLDNSGNFLWAKTMGGIGSEAAQSIAIDDSNNIYTTGTFESTADFDPDSSTTFNLTANGVGLEIFISKLDSSGKFVWAKSFGGIEDDQGYSISLDDSGNVYTTGYFEKTADFDPGAGIYNLTSTGNLPDIFISKLDRNGNFVWAKAMNGSADNDGTSITVDKLGNVYTTGYFIGTVDFDPDSSGIYNVTTTGFYDIFIVKLDSSGNFIWAKSMGGTDDDQSFSIALDDSCNIYTTGIFRTSADFDPDLINVYTISANGGFDLFVTKLDSAGNFIWALGAGGTSKDQGTSIVPDGLGNVYLGGFFYSPSLTLGTDTLLNADPSGFNSDIFISRLGTPTTGLEKINLETLISIYPNPANKILIINIPSSKIQEITINIFDVSGKLIYTVSEKAVNKIFIKTETFPVGIYFAQIRTPDFTETKKIIIEN